jgi:hypothetical protein
MTGPFAVRRVPSSLPGSTSWPAMRARVMPTASCAPPRAGRSGRFGDHLGFMDKPGHEGTPGLGVGSLDDPLDPFVVRRSGLAFARCHMPRIDTLKAVHDSRNRERTCCVLSRPSHCRRPVWVTKNCRKGHSKRFRITGGHK